jgi:hypothetical protein
MNKRTLFSALSLGLLAACAQLSPHEAAHNTNARRVILKARVRSDHDALSEYFENIARKMQAKAEEEKKLLEHYEEKSYLYGRRAQDLKAHTAALVRKYTKSAEENMKQAALHRKMAREQAQRDLNARLLHAAQRHEDEQNPRLGE